MSRLAPTPEPPSSCSNSDSEETRSPSPDGDRLQQRHEQESLRLAGIIRHENPDPHAVTNWKTLNKLNTLPVIRDLVTIVAKEHYRFVWRLKWVQISLEVKCFLYKSSEIEKKSSVFTNLSKDFDIHRFSKEI